MNAVPSRAGTALRRMTKDPSIKRTAQGRKNGDQVKQGSAYLGFVFTWSPLSNEVALPGRVWLTVSAVEGPQATLQSNYEPLEKD